MLDFSPQDADSLDQESPHDLATSPTSAVLLPSSVSLPGPLDVRVSEERPYPDSSTHPDDATQPESPPIAAFGAIPQATSPSKSAFDDVPSTPLNDTRFKASHTTFSFGQVSIP